MTGGELRQMLDALAAAWAAHDPARAAAFFAADVRYADPTRYRLRGREAVRAFFADDGGLPQSTTWHHVVFDEQQQLGAVEYTYVGTHRYHGLVLVKLDAAGLVSHWREYQHTSDLDWAAYAGETRF